MDTMDTKPGIKTTMGRWKMQAVDKYVTDEQHVETQDDELLATTLHDSIHCSLQPNAMLDWIISTR